jgi:hypothetical protein
MLFDTAPSVGLESSLGHLNPLLFLNENLRVSSMFEYTGGLVMNPARCVPHDAAPQTFVLRYAESAFETNSWNVNAMICGLGHKHRSQ